MDWFPFNVLVYDMITNRQANEVETIPLVRWIPFNVLVYDMMMHSDRFRQGSMHWWKCNLITIGQATTMVAIPLAGAGGTSEFPHFACCAVQMRAEKD